MKPRYSELMEPNPATAARNFGWKNAARCIVALCLGLVLLLRPDLVGRVSQHSALMDASAQTLDESLDRNLITFLSLSAIKSVLALIEGSSVGVGFDIEVGDVIQPAYDYLDFVWTVFVYALLVLGFYKLLLETGILGVGFAFVGGGLILIAIGRLPTGAADTLRRWGRFMGLAGILVSYIVPLSLLATQYVGDKYLAPVKESNAARIDAVRGNFDSAQEQLLDLRDKISLLNPGESYDQIKSSALSIATRVADSVWGSLFAFLNFILILLVELLLLPFLSAYLLYRILAIAAGGFPGQRATGDGVGTGK